MTNLTIARYADLDGKTVFISGGASGIGATMVEAFCRQGVATHFVDIDTATADALVARLAAETGNPPVFSAVDVTDTDKLADAVAGAQRATGRLDGLINNAAHDERHDIAAVTSEEWDRRIAVNVKHQFFAAQAAFRFMKDQGAGTIINFGSVAPRVKVEGLAVYSTAKTAVTGLTRSLAREFGHAGVRVNTIVPGCILTPRQLDLWITPEDEAKILQDQCLHRRLIEEDVAQMALFLISDVSSAMTAQDFIVDGGLT